ncbi:AI-2E family transporter [Haloimpatiens lingqiaonensis]|uniref:AI-2E family transporter n=1 Tax=Haloimpatiens lingqiaonensis TaxID=1380675 RepID=UPI0037C197AA
MYLNKINLIMKEKKILFTLIIINLTLLAIHFFIKLPIVIKTFSSIYKLIIIPILISIFIYYLLKPLRNIFIKKGLKNTWAAGLTLIIAMTIALGIIEGLGFYFISQLSNLIEKLSIAQRKNNLMDFINKNLSKNINVQWILEQLTIYIKTYLYLFKNGAFKTANFVMVAFSDVLLIIIIVFYLLKDDGDLKKNILKIIPQKYKNKYGDKLEDVCTKCDFVLSNYIIGQAKVALSLASMIYIGYLIIGIPSGLILASITFVLAFIPFVGFFISMIIPYIIAFSMGFKMIIKLSLLFIIAQAIKGRVIVPLVMSKAMEIHALTDIFLVVSAASIFGPIGAFIVVPIYSVIKVIITTLKNENSPEK